MGFFKLENHIKLKRPREQWGSLSWLWKKSVVLIKSFAFGFNIRYLKLGISRFQCTSFLSIGRKFQKKNWLTLHPPKELNYFASLELLLFQNSSLSEFSNNFQTKTREIKRPSSFITAKKFFEFGWYGNLCKNLKSELLYQMHALRFNMSRCSWTTLRKVEQILREPSENKLGIHKPKITLKGKQFIHRLGFTMTGWTQYRVTVDHKHVKLTTM